MIHSTMSFPHLQGPVMGLDTGSRHFAKGSERCIQFKKLTKQALPLELVFATSVSMCH